MKYTLSQLYGKAVGSLIHQMSEASLERKQQICEDILLLFDIIEPGMTQSRGIVLNSFLFFSFIDGVAWINGGGKVLAPRLYGFLRSNPGNV